MQVNLNEAVVYIRELLYMNKTELFREANFSDSRKVRKCDALLFAFERKFNPKVKDPTTLFVPPTNIHYGKQSGS